MKKNMSNKKFEDKVLKVLWNIEKDISWLKSDVSAWIIYFSIISFDELLK